MSTLKLIIAAVLAIVILGLATTAAIYRGNAISAQAEAARLGGELDKATAANDEFKKTVAALQEQSRLDGRLVASLVEGIRTINDSLTDQTKALDDLEKANAEVRDYLNLPVPADIRKLHNH